MPVHWIQVTQNAFQHVSLVFLWIVALTMFYNVALMLVGLAPNKKIRLISHDSTIKPATRFAIVIAAHDEEIVLPNLIDTLLAQDYPRHLFDIFVIADNCKDRTAEVAEELGAIVYKRQDLTRRTKGYALNWFFKLFLADYGERYDACLVFDADNLAKPDYLSIMNRQYQSGNKFCVGFRDSKNITDGPIATASSIFFWYQIRFLYQPRTTLGLPLHSVAGTGFMFALDYIKPGGWNTSSVTEDTEFTMQMSSTGHYAVLVRDALFYDEQPNDWDTMITQRFRWSVGLIQTMRLMMPSLLRRARSGDLRILDTVWFLLQIPCFFVATLLSVFTFLSHIPLYAVQPGLIIPDMIIPAACGYLFMLLSAFSLFLLEKKPLRHCVSGLLLYPVIASIWGLQQLFALFCRDVAWKPIEHKRSVNLDELP